MISGVNLIPLARQHARRRSLRLRRWLFVGGAWLVLLLGACIGAHLAAAGTEDPTRRLTDAQLRVADLTAKTSNLRKSLAQTESLRQTAVSLSDQPDWSILLSMLGDLVERDVVLREIQLRGGGADRASYTLDLRGYAKTQAGVADFVLRLQRTGLLDDVKLQRTGREPLYDTSAVTFEISCGINALPGGPG